MKVWNYIMLLVKKVKLIDPIQAQVTINYQHLQHPTVHYTMAVETGWGAFPPQGVGNDVAK